MENRPTFRGLQQLPVFAALLPFFAALLPFFAALLPVFATLTAALFLRLYEIDFGLPDPYHPDEFRKANIVRGMMARASIDPQYALHPTLLLYLSWIVSKLLLFAGVAPDADSIRIVLAGRLTSALTGTGSVYLVYLLARRISGETAALTAAFLLAVSPLHVTSSRYFKEDILLTFFLVAALLVLVKAVQENRRKMLYGAAFLAGASLASKWTGLLSLSFVFLAPWMKSPGLRPDRDWLRALPFALGAFAIGFFVFCPYALIDPLQYVTGFLREKNHAMQGHRGIQISALGNLFSYHLTKSLIPGTHLVVVLAAAVGILFSATSRLPLLLAGICGMFYFAAELAPSRPLPQPERYIIPCLPFVAIFAGIAVERLAGKRAAAAGILASLLVLLPCSRSVMLARSLGNDTRVQMRAWINSQIPRGTSIATLGSALSAPRLRKHNLRPVSEIVSRGSDTVVPELRAAGIEYLLVASPIHPRFEESRPGRRPRESRPEIEELPVLVRFDDSSLRYAFHNPKLILYSLRLEDSSRR